MEQERKERLRHLAIKSLPVVLGAVAVKNVHERHKTRHISYWEASQTMLMDLLEDGRESIRVAGTVIHGPGGRQDIQDVEIYEGFEYSPEDVARMERAFLARRERAKLTLYKLIRFGL